MVAMEATTIMAMEATTIIAVRQHQGRRSSTRTIRQTIRGQTKSTIQDTMKEAPTMTQRILGGQMTLGTIVIQVVVET